MLLGIWRLRSGLWRARNNRVRGECLGLGGMSILQAGVGVWEVGMVDCNAIVLEISMFVCETLSDEAETLIVTIAQPECSQ